MNDKFEHGPQNIDPHGPHDCDHHDHHHWGPHGPDGAYVPRYVWPDVYHPVPYGREYEGNENLSLEGEHWCPPRDHGRHGCHHEPCHDHHHYHCDFIGVMGDYLETAQKYINATTYQERCDCVNELQRIKVKIQKTLKDLERHLDTNDKELWRLKEKLAYFFGKVQSIQKDLQENMLRQDEMTAAFEEMSAAFKDLQEAYEQYQDTNTTYELSKSGRTITLTGSDGSTTSVQVDEDSNTTYTISKSGDTVTLTGSDGSTTSFQVDEDTNTTYQVSYSGNTLTLTGSDGSTSTATITMAPEATSADILSILN